MAPAKRLKQDNKVNNWKLEIILSKLSKGKTCINNNCSLHLEENIKIRIVNYKSNDFICFVTVFLNFYMSGSSWQSQSSDTHKESLFTNFLDRNLENWVLPFHTNHFCHYISSCRKWGCDKSILGNINTTHEWGCCRIA